MKPFTSKHITPINYGSPLEQKGFTKTLTNKKKEKDPNTSTRTYNAATGITHESMLDDGGNLVTPGYDFKKAAKYEANAIKKYGSLEKSREALKNKVNKYMQKYK